MKKLLYIAAGLFVLGTTTANAQKTGHVNSQEILTSLPDYKTAETEMKKWQTERMADYEKMEATLKNLYAKYNAEKETLSVAVKTIREQDILDYENKLQEFQQNLQTESQKREQILVEPLIKKVKDAIGKVAKAQGINYVFDTNTLIFQEGGNDLTPLVKKELGITTP